MEVGKTYIVTLVRVRGMSSHPPEDPLQYRVKIISEDENGWNGRRADYPSIPFRIYRSDVESLRVLITPD